MNEQLKLSQLTISAQSVSIINGLINSAEKFMNTLGDFVGAKVEKDTEGEG